MLQSWYQKTAKSLANTLLSPAKNTLNVSFKYLYKVQSHLKFSKILGGSEPHVHNSLRFAKSCILSCLSKFDSFEKWALKVEIEGVFSRL